MVSRHKEMLLLFWLLLSWTIVCFELCQGLWVEKKKYDTEHYRSLTSGLCVVNLSLSTHALFFLFIVFYCALSASLCLCPFLFPTIILPVVFEHVNTPALSVSLMAPWKPVTPFSAGVFLCACVAVCVCAPIGGIGVLFRFFFFF